MKEREARVELPLEILLIALGVLLLLGLAVKYGGRFFPTGKSPEEGKERDWAIPTIDSQAQGHSLFHRWDARIKIVALVFFMFCAASVQNMAWALATLLVSALSILVAQIPLHRPLRRLRAMVPFLTMFLVVMPLTVPQKSGDLMVSFAHVPFLEFNGRGLELALLIVVKASAIALLVEPLVATAPFPATVQALARLKVPPMVCQMILLAHRYIFVFQHEAERMGKGMRARGFRKRTNLETLRTLGNFLGMLLVRTFDRTQRVHEAMLARGYANTFPQKIEFRARREDWLKGALWAGAGLGLLMADRWVKWTFFS